MIPQVTLALALYAAPLAVNGATFFEDFEAYAPGSDLHGQGGWKGWANDPAAGALASNAYSYSGPTSVAIAGASDLVHEFSGVTSGQWVFSTMLHIPSVAAGQTYLILMSSYSDDGASNVWSLQTNFNMDTGLVTSEMGGGGTLALVKDMWVPFRAEIDLDANTFSEFYNDQLLGSGTWSTGPVQVQAIDLFANNAGAVYYDNINLVPESSSIALAAAGALGLCLRRRRARA